MHKQDKRRCGLAASSLRVLGISGLVLSAVCLSVTSAASLCPVDICSMTKCLELQDTDCNGGYIKPNSSACACCSSCIKLLDQGEPCMMRVTIPPESECNDGLVCSEKSGTCVPTPDPSTPLQILGSPQHITSCEEEAKRNPVDRVICAPDGTYAPKQCRGSDCFCVTPEGMPLDYNVEKKRASKMECLCARVEHAITNFIDSKIMCDELGNYKKG